jgi:hypothetical protein
MIKLIDLLKEELSNKKIYNIGNALISMGIENENELDKLVDDVLSKVSDKKFMDDIEKEKESKEKEPTKEEPTKEKEVEPKLPEDTEDIKNAPRKAKEFLNLIGIKKYSLSNKNEYNIPNSINLVGKKLDSIPIPLLVVMGDVILDKNKFKDLTNFPKQVEGNLSLADNISLISLKGIPKIIKGNLILTNCNGLYKIDSFPNEVKNVMLKGITSLQLTPSILNCNIKGTIYLDEGTFSDEDLEKLKEKFVVSFGSPKKSFFSKLLGKS